MVGHDPEGDAARYLGGQMSVVRRARYSEHLLDCDPCWSEVAQAQEGRRLVEATRTAAPAHLRERLRAAAEAYGTLEVDGYAYRDDGARTTSWSAAPPSH